MKRMINCTNMNTLIPWILVLLSSYLSIQQTSANNNFQSNGSKTPNERSFSLHGSSRSLQDKPKSNNARYKTVYACEGKILEISCEEGSLIHLIRANYGRYSISICNDHGNLDWKVDCTSPHSYEVISKRCGQRNSCRVPASSSIFDDPCPLTFKYLEVHYQCKEAIGNSADSKTWSGNRPPTIIGLGQTTLRPPIIVPITSTTRSSTVASTARGSTIATTTATPSSINFRISTISPLLPWRSTSPSSSKELLLSTGASISTQFSSISTITTSAPWSPPKVSIITPRTTTTTVRSSTTSVPTTIASASRPSQTTTLPTYERHNSLQGIQGRRVTTDLPWLRARLSTIAPDVGSYPVSPDWTFSPIHPNSSFKSFFPSNLPENSGRTTRARTTNILVVVSISSVIAIIIYSITLLLLIISRITSHRQIIYKNLCFILILTSIILCILSLRPWTEAASPMCNVIGIILHFLLQAIFNLIFIDSIRVYCCSSSSSSASHASPSSTAFSSHLDCDKIDSPSSLSSSLSISNSLSLLSKESLTLYLVTYGLPILTIGTSYLIDPTLIYRGLGPGAIGLSSSASSTSASSLSVTMCWFTGASFYQSSLWVFLPTFLSIFFTALLILLTIYGKINHTEHHHNHHQHHTNRPSQLGLNHYGSSHHPSDNNSHHYKINGGPGTLTEYCSGPHAWQATLYLLILECVFWLTLNIFLSISPTNIPISIIFVVANVINAIGLFTVTFLRNNKVRHNIRKWLATLKWVPSCFKSDNIGPSLAGPLPAPMTACFYSLDPSHLMSPPSPIIKLTSSSSSCSSSRLHGINNNNSNHLHHQQQTLQQHHQLNNLRSSSSSSIEPHYRTASQETLPVPPISANPRHIPEVSPYAPPVPIYLHEYEDISSNLTDGYSFGQPRHSASSYYYHTTRSPIYYSERKQVSLD